MAFTSCVPSVLTGFIWGESLNQCFRDLWVWRRIPSKRVPNWILGYFSRWGRNETLCVNALLSARMSMIWMTDYWWYQHWCQCTHGFLSVPGLIPLMVMDGTKLSGSAPLYCRDLEVEVALKLVAPHPLTASSDYNERRVADALPCFLALPFLEPPQLAARSYIFYIVTSFGEILH